MRLQNRHGGSTPLESKKIFTFNPAKNPNTSDRVFREQQIKSWHLRNEERTTTTLNDTPKESKGGIQHLRTRATQHAIKAIEYFRMLQCEDGHWAGDYGGPHFLLPGLVIVWYVTGKAEHVLNVKQRAAMSHYLVFINSEMWMGYTSNHPRQCSDCALLRCVETFGC